MSEPSDRERGALAWRMQLCRAAARAVVAKMVGPMPGADAAELVTEIAGVLDQIVGPPVEQLRAAMQAVIDHASPGARYASPEHAEAQVATDFERIRAALNATGGGG